MPRGTALIDARQQLLAAAERLVRREGAAALSSRAVTTEAGLGKGVLHYHFTDFDSLLAALIDDRVEDMNRLGRSLMAAVGEADVSDTLSNTLVEIVDAARMASSALLVRRAGHHHGTEADAGVHTPFFGEATSLLAAYLAAERQLGRLGHDAHERTLAFMLIGGTQMLLAEQGPRPHGTTIDAMIATIVGSSFARR